MNETMNLSRRQLIGNMGAGLGSLGLISALRAEGSTASRLAPHFMPRAKRVIHLFMNGGPFGPDFLDPKPALTKYAGRTLRATFRIRFIF